MNHVGITSACLLLAVMIAGPVQAQTTVGVAYWYPKYFEDIPSGCTQEGMIDRLEEREGRLYYDTDGEYDQNQDDDIPQSVERLIELVKDNRVILVSSHGPLTGGFAVQCFGTTSARGDSLTALRSRYGDADFVAATGPDPDYMPMISITPTGIDDLFEPDLDSDALIGGFYCHSLDNDSWNASSPRTIVGYRGEQYSNTNCDRMERFINRITCGSAVFLDTVDRAVDCWIFDCLDPLEYAGDGANRINPSWSCLNWSSALWACARNDSIRWVALDGCASEDYVVRWFDSPTAEPETLAVVPGIGEGPGSWCGYGIPSVQTGGFGEIVERKNGTFAKASELFEPEVAPESWVEVGPGTCLEAPEDTVSAVPDSVLEHTPSGFIWHVIGSGPREEDPQEDDCADVVVYGTGAEQTWMARARDHIDNYQTQGRALRARCFVGNENPLTARENYRDVVRANDAWNDQIPPPQHVYPSQPLLMILGNYVHKIMVEDNLNICNGFCGSLSAITDLNNDTVPDGAVTQIPASTYQQLSQACQMADDWNQGNFVDPDEAVAIFLGDRYSATEADPEWEDDPWQSLARTYQWSGHPLRCMLRESSYAPNDWPGTCGAGRSCLEGGVRDLWVQGLSTTYNDLTHLLCPGSYPAQEKQRVMLFAPTCYSGYLSAWNDSSTVTLRRMMFGDPEGAVAAGFVGCTTSGYEPQHGLFRDLLLTEIAASDPGRLYADVVKSVAQTLWESWPGYAGGIQMFGGIVKVPGDIHISGVAEEAPAPGVALRWAAQGGGGTLEYELAGDWEVDLAVFDVGGRLVATLDEGARSGRQQVQWMTKGVPSGVYFARLSAKRQGEEIRSATRIVVIH
jgi:hypothetical protein